VRIDRPDLADEAVGTDMTRRTRSTPDDSDAASKDRAGAGRSDDHLSSFSRVPESSLYIERDAAYRVAIDAVHRQAIGQDVARAGPSSGDTHRNVTETILFGRSASSTEYPAIGIAVDTQTGARGPASGRPFEPEAAGGPIQQLDATGEVITSEGVQRAAAHLQRFTGGGTMATPERAMLDRLTSIAAGDTEPTCYDLNFYTHELDEAARYAQLGFGPESGADLGSPDMYEVWNNVHTAALEDYGISGADVFLPELRHE